MSNTGPESGFPPPPPPPTGGSGFGAPPPPVPVRRLVRNPDARLGGVCSGLGQHFGIDVSVVRLGFVLFTIVTGLGLILYPLAWIIIPKAQIWPPASGQGSARSLSNRELALAAVLIGLALLVFVSGGSTGEVIIPLLLVGGGIWLLTQSNQTATNTSSAGPFAGQPMANQSQGSQPLTDTPGYQSATQSQQYERYAEKPWGDDWSGPASYALGSPPPPQQGPRKRRPLRGIIIAIIAVIGGFFALIIALVAAVFAFGDVELDFSEGTQTVRPLTVADIPSEFHEGDGELIIDLSDLDATMFEALEEPVKLDVDRDVGAVRVVIPEDLTVDIDAQVGLGDVDVFDEGQDGFQPRVTVDASDPDLELDINLGLGAIIVERP